MATQHIKPAYAKIDPAHLFDGLFVPTNGVKRGKLLVPPRRFGDLEIGFQGFEQLGVDDQSVLLALSAQLGIDGLVIGPDPKGPVSQQLRLALDFSMDDGADVTSRRTTLRSVLIDAGYSTDSGKQINVIKTSLNRIRAAQIREVNKKTGWDRVCNLISVAYNAKTEEIYVAANPRLTRAVFKGQHIRVSLYERNALQSEVAKLLHSWLCSNIRLGQSIGNGNGVEIDRLGPHVWGGAAWEDATAKVKSKRRGLIRSALDEISDSTRPLFEGYGWEIDCTSTTVLISRPREIPMNEELFRSPSEQDETEQEMAEWITLGR